MPTRRPISATTGLRALGLVLALPLLAACDLPWSVSSTPTPRATIQAGTPVALGAGAWQRIALPTPPQDVDGYTVSSTAPDTLFACTDEPAPRTLWRTTDAGAHWTNFGSLAGTGTGCLFSFAPDDPERILVQISNGVQHGQFCASDTDYLSNDGGTNWKRLAPYSLNIPASAPYDSCAVEISRDHLFLSYDSSDPRTPGSLLARSDDEGRTWRRIDGTIGDGSLFFPPQIGPGDRLAMTVLHFPTPPTSETVALWTSADAGTTWTKASTLPDYPGAFLLSSLPASGARWPEASHPFYALETEQIPSDLYRESALASADGIHWSQLPNLPVPGVSDERHGILQVLAALPDGRLAIWGTDPQAGIPTTPNPAELQVPLWLWLWNPTSRAWQVVSPPLVASAHGGCGLCWQGNASGTADGATYLYVSSLYAAIPSEVPVGLYRLRIPPA